MIKSNRLAGLTVLACLLLVFLAYLRPRNPGESNAAKPGPAESATAPSSREAELQAALVQREIEVTALRTEVAMLESLLAENREAAASVQDVPASDTAPSGSASVGAEAVDGGIEAPAWFFGGTPPEQFDTAEEIASITSMDLEGVEVTDADLADIAWLPGLERISLNGTAVTDAGLAYLRALPGLTSLDLRATQVTGAGLWNLPAGQLKALHLTDTQVSADDLGYLPAMPNLQTLKLNGLNLGDEGLAHLSHLPSLQHLELDRTSITDHGLRSLLEQHPALTRVEIRDTGVTPEGLAALRQEYPHVEFVW